MHDIAARPDVAQIVKTEVGNFRFYQTAFPGRTDRLHALSLIGETPFRGFTRTYERWIALRCRHNRLCNRQISFQLSEYHLHCFFRKSLKRLSRYIAKGIEVKKHGHGRLGVRCFQYESSIVKPLSPIDILNNNAMSFNSPIDNVVEYDTDSPSVGFECLRLIRCLGYVTDTLIGKHIRGRSTAAAPEPGCGVSMPFTWSSGCGFLARSVTAAWRRTRPGCSPPSR